jgi:hypothetical protein
MSLNEALQAIRNEKFSANKVNVAKQIISGRWMTSNHLLEVVKSFTFSNDKLEVAKFGYHHVIDPGNYFVVNGGFKFSNDKDELHEYIMSQR